MTGIIEVDETYVGGKPRKGGVAASPGRGTKKTPVCAVIERGGNVHAKVLTRVTSRNLLSAIKETVDFGNSQLMTDEFRSYTSIGHEFANGHKVVYHSAGEYSRGEAHTNSAESFFAIVKRGLYGVYHSVSKKHLHRYMNEFAFRFNGRKLTDGDRTARAIRGAEGKRLYYRDPVAKQAG